MQSETSYMALENHDFPTQSLTNLNLDSRYAIKTSYTALEIPYFGTLSEPIGCPSPTKLELRL